MFLYDRRHSYFAKQLRNQTSHPEAQDARYALMRYSGNATAIDDLIEKLDRLNKRIILTKWRGRPDRKRMKRSHRHG